MQNNKEMPGLAGVMQNNHKGKKKSKTRSLKNRQTDIQRKMYEKKQSLNR